MPFIHSTAALPINPAAYTFTPVAVPQAFILPKLMVPTFPVPVNAILCWFVVLSTAWQLYSSVAPEQFIKEKEKVLMIVGFAVLMRFYAKKSFAAFAFHEHEYRIDTGRFDR